MSTAKVLRSGSAQKRTAILSAARDLFLTDGYERTSVDAVAARAAVSKRTVYDYFGDKRALLHAVVDVSWRTLVATVRRTLDATVTEDVDADGLQDALTGFALRISTEMVGSADYTALLRLTRATPAELSEEQIDAIDNAPEEVLAERLAALGRAGLLEVPDARLAAEHLIALTFSVAHNRLRTTSTAEDPRVGPLIVEGVRAFLRAYRPRP